MDKNIILIQPPVFKSEMNVDIIQSKYWDAIDTNINSILNRYNLLNGVTGFSFIEPNIGLLYIAGALKQNGYTIKYLDGSIIDTKIRKKYQRPVEINDIKTELKKIPGEYFNIAAISHMTVNYGWAVKIAEAIKEINSNCVVVLGGVHASFEYQNILKTQKCVDFICIGEGERTIVELADKYYESGFDPENFREVDGLAYRSLNGKIIVTKPREFIGDLDSLPYPMYELLPREIVDNLMIRVITSRGCSNNCSFCVPSKVFNRLRFRKAGCVIDELEYYVKKYNWKLFMIGDLNFLSSYEYAREFCDEIIARKLDIKWICQSRADLIDGDLTSKMYDAGCIMVCLGIESADQEILDLSNKQVTAGRCIEACRTVKRAGLNLYTYWVFGLPGETHDSAHATIRLLRYFLDEKLIDMTHCTVCVPYPGTDLYKHPEKYNIKLLHNDFNEYWLNCDYLGSGLPVMETEQLSRYEIYAYWQMALAVVAGNLIK